MLPPAGKFTGSAPARTVKVLIDVLSCAICTGDVLWFEIETVWDTGVPTLTSPNSIAVGFIETASVVAVENG